IGELGNYKGTDYIAREFTRLGLKPAGDNGTYFQDMPYGPIAIDVASMQLVAAGAPLAPRTDWVPIAPTAGNGVGGSVSLNAVPTVFAGRWGDTVSLDPAVFRGRVAIFTATPAAAGLGG